MLTWKNQSIDLLNQGDFRIVKPGPLHVPIESFSIRRDENLALTLETEAALTAKSTTVQHPSGTVFLNTEKIELDNIYGIKAVLSGVISHSVSTSQIPTKPHLSGMKEVASIHQIAVTLGDPENAAYTIEWLENLPVSPFIWPDSIRIKTEATTVWSIAALSDDGITLSDADHSGGSHYAASKLTVAGHTFYVCALGELDGSSGIKPGCIIYIGTPDELVRKKIRTALSFAFGVYLIDLGHTLYDQEWRVVFADARSAYSLGQRAFDLLPMPLAPLSDRNWQNDLGRAKLTRMVNALFSAYEALDLGNLSWAYWHARTATVHIAPAHFGAAIEALQRTYARSHPDTIATTVLAKAKWKPLKEAICDAIANATIPEDSKATIKGNIRDINRVPIRDILKATFSTISIELGEEEDIAWRRRNDAAHGSPIPEGEALSAIRDMKLLTGLFHRMLLRITDASDAYIDYVTPGHPCVPLRTPPSMG